VSVSASEQEARALSEFSRHYGLQFQDPALLKLALTHRSYLSVTGQGPRESNERLEFLGDSVLGLVTSEFLYREHPTEHEGQLTKAKSLLVSKAILSRRALAMGLGRFVLMSHSEVESGGRQRLSILADAFESVVGAIYLDLGFEASRQFIERWLLRDASEIASDKRHTNYKSHLQEYVQSTFRTHPAYRIRSEVGPDHSKHFIVEVMVGRRVLGEGKGRNKKEAEQAAARDALDRVGGRTSDRERTERPERPERSERAERPERTERAESSGERRGGRDRGAVVDEPVQRRTERELIEADTVETVERETQEGARRRRGRRGGRGRRERAGGEPARREPASSAAESAPTSARVSAPLPRTIEPSSPFALPPEDGRFERLRREAELNAENDVEVVEVEPMPPDHDDDDFEEVGRPEGPREERHVDVYAAETPVMESRRRPEPIEPLEPVWESDEDADVDPDPEAAERELAEEFETRETREIEAEELERPVSSADRPAPPQAPPPSPPAAFGRRPGRSRRGGR